MTQLLSDACHAIQISNDEPHFVTICALLSVPTERVSSITVIFVPSYLDKEVLHAKSPQGQHELDFFHDTTVDW